MVESVLKLPNKCGFCNVFPCCRCKKSLIILNELLFSDGIVDEVKQKIAVNQSVTFIFIADERFT